MRLLTSTLGLFALLGLLAYTNPSMAMYQQYLRESMIRDSRHDDPASKALAALFSRLASGILASETSRTDYVFCSVYVTELGGRRIEALGALNNFFVLKRSASGHLSAEVAHGSGGR